MPHPTTRPTPPRPVSARAISAAAGPPPALIRRPASPPRSPQRPGPGSGRNRPRFCRLLPALALLLATLSLFHAALAQPPPGLPGAPTALTATPGNRELALGWTAPSGTVDGYVVYYTSAPRTGSGAVADDAEPGRDPATEWVFAYSAGQTSYTLPGLTNGTAYRVRVAAFRSTSFGPYAHVSGTPTAAAQSSDARLGALTASGAASAGGTYSALALTPASFDAATTSYTATVEHAVTHVKLTPTASHASATVTVQRSAVTSGQASAAVALSVGANTLTVRVTAQDTATTQDYTVTVTRQASGPTRITGGPPAQGALWYATLTVQAGTFGKGCLGATSCATHLTDNDFRLDGTTYTVTFVQLSDSGSLIFRVNATLPAAKRRLVLFAGDAPLPGWEADFGTGTNPARSELSWGGTGRSWSAGEQVRLTLVELPTVSLDVSPWVREGIPAKVEVRLHRAGRSHVPAGTVHIPVAVTRVTAERGDLCRVFEERFSIAVSIHGAHQSASAVGKLETCHDMDSDDETFTVALQAHRLPAGYVLSADRPVSAQITVGDDEADGGPPGGRTVTLRVHPNPVAEGHAVTVTATLEFNGSPTVSQYDEIIPIRVYGITSEPGDHGTLGSITIPRYHMSAAAAVATQRDGDRDDERFVVQLITLPVHIGPGRCATVRVTISEGGAERLDPCTGLSVDANLERLGVRQ